MMMMMMMMIMMMMMMTSFPRLTPTRVSRTPSLPGVSALSELWPPATVCSEATVT